MLIGICVEICGADLPMEIHAENRCIQRPKKFVVFHFPSSFLKEEAAVVVTREGHTAVPYQEAVSITAIF